MCPIPWIVKSWNFWKQACERDEYSVTKLSRIRLGRDGRTYFNILQWMLYKLLCRPHRSRKEMFLSLRACSNFSIAEVIIASSKHSTSLEDSSVCWSGLRCLKHRFSSCTFQVEIPKRLAKGTNISNVSLANLCRLHKGRASRVIMLCSRSANLIRTALASAMARNMVCSRSASTVLLAVLFSRASLLNWLSFET